MRTETPGQLNRHRLIALLANKYRLPIHGRKQRAYTAQGVGRILITNY